MSAYVDACHDLPRQEALLGGIAMTEHDAYVLQVIRDVLF